MLLACERKRNLFTLTMVTATLALGQAPAPEPAPDWAQGGSGGVVRWWVCNAMKVFAGLSRYEAEWAGGVI